MDKERLPMEHKAATVWDIKVYKQLNALQLR